MKRRDIYRLRDEIGLLRQELYLKYFHQGKFPDFLEVKR